MSLHDHWMHRCLQLARNGRGQVAPNPMVGAVLVQGERLLSEGWHRAIGGPHAEVECLRAFGDGPVPADAVMYVNLEPCAHHGRTPPCVDLLISRGVKHVVIGCGDPNPLVHGAGIARAREAGIKVITDVLLEESRWLNRRFIHSFEQQRPYVVLKWARSADGFLDDHGRSARISSPATDVLVHAWRAEEQAILIGSRTALNDDPALNVRHGSGRHPLRVVIDREGTVPSSAKVFDGTSPTLLISRSERTISNTDVLMVGDADPVDTVLQELHRRSMRSVLVEGGAELLGHFLRRGLWDEARVISGIQEFKGGTPAPLIDAMPKRWFTSGTDRIDLFTHTQRPADAWDW